MLLNTMKKMIFVACTKLITPSAFYITNILYHNNSSNKT